MRARDGKRGEKNQDGRDKTLAARPTVEMMPFSVFIDALIAAGIFNE
jgi:hypothetical protein